MKILVIYADRTTQIIQEQDREGEYRYDVLQRVRHSDQLKKDVKVWEFKFFADNEDPMAWFSEDEKRLEEVIRENELLLKLIQQRGINGNKN